MHTLFRLGFISRINKHYAQRYFKFKEAIEIVKCLPVALIRLMNNDPTIEVVASLSLNTSNKDK